MLAYNYIKQYIIDLLLVFKSNKYTKSGITFKRNPKTNKLSIYSLSKYLSKRKLKLSDLNYRDIKIKESYYLHKELLSVLEISLVLDIRPRTVYTYIKIFVTRENNKNEKQLELSINQ
jgi:DNA-binding CsgD family transcriptional regulator